MGVHPARLPAAQAIRGAFSLDINLYAIQNKDRRRVMFNQDVSGGLAGLVK